MEGLEVFANKMNVFFGVVTAVLTMIFGDYWIFFLGFFILNAVDYVTGFMKARHTKTESSAKGAHGIAKKVGYWLIVGIAFFVSVSCIELGKIIGVDLFFLSIFGYFTLATYIINEIRSIIENLIAIGVHVPDFLTKGLAIADKLVKDAVSLKFKNNKSNNEK